jgi:glycosyltransferase involved in cell wall biosynthesis
MAKIYWAIHGYPPQQNAGAEWMAKEINWYLQQKGHSIFIHDLSRSLEGEIEEIVPDIIMTHLDLSEAATRLALAYRIPCINIVHHTFPISHLRANYQPAINNTHVVYNAQWVADSCRYPHKSIVVHPPVNPERFEGLSGYQDGHITMVNCNKDKGALVFQEITRAMPHRNFLAVKGNHGPQLTLKAKNLKQIDQQDDIREVLSQTALLLIPSIYESYGRIGLEAMACGIPVIATTTDGLKEALSDTDAVFIHNRSFIPSWIQNINVISRWPWETEQLQLRKQAVAFKWDRSLNELEALHNVINSLV